MSDTSKTLSGRELLVWGVVSVVLGMLPMLSVAGVLPRPGGGDAPGWVIVTGGMVFVLGGVAVILMGLGGASSSTGEFPDDAPSWIRRLAPLTGLAVTVLLAVIGTWIALGPGDRAFGFSLGSFVEGPANVVIGRTVFGLGAAVTWLFVVVSARRAFRRS